MDEKIFIPTKCKVGFQNREDTYTKKLGYVIYNDGKVWRKEKSWESWRFRFKDPIEYEKLRKQHYDNSVKAQRQHYQSIIADYKLRPTVYNTSYYLKCVNSTEEEFIQNTIGPYKKYKPHLGQFSSDPTIQPKEFDNVARDGFVLNKKAGGDKYGWNPRQTYCRVYDPLGFEFEITIPNLLYILENTSSIKGKGLDGKFIYGWSGTELVLIPENSPEYADMIKFTALQTAKNIKKSDLKLGYKYLCSDNVERTYMGEHIVYDYYGVPKYGKKLWFYNNEYKSFNTENIAKIKTELTLDPDYSNLLSELEKDKYYAGIGATLTKFEEKDSIINSKAFYIKQNNRFVECSLYGKTYSLGGYMFEINRTGQREIFSSIKDLLKKYEIWQIKTTTK